MPVKPYTDFEAGSGTSKTRKYPNPFFDLAQNYLPKSIKTLFRYCRNFFYTNGFLRNVITKLTEYPITDIQFNTGTDGKIREKYIKALHEKLKIKSFLIEVGLDYFTYGNCFISTSMKPKRFCVFPDGERVPIEQVNYKMKNFELYTANKNGAQVKLKLEDEFVKTIDNLTFVRWSPENIDIEYNPVTGNSTYYYTIPKKVKSAIISGNKSILKDIPLVFLESLRKKKRIELDPNNLFHFKRPSLAEDDMGWGKPIILPALKEIYYLQTLKRGNEAIANEHIIPKKAIFPANTTTLDPYSMHPDTFVETSEGYKQLKDVVDNASIKLVTERGEPTHIVDYKLREIEDWDYMVDIKSYGLFGISTIVNSVHPFKVYNSNTNTMEWKQAKDLTLDDYTGYLIKSYEDPIAGAFSNIQDIDIKLYESANYRKGTQQLQSKLTMDNNLARFLGFFIAEGYTGKKGMIGFGFHAKETEYHEFCADYLDKLLPNTSTEIRIRDNSCDVRKNSVVLKDFLDNFIGRGFNNKTLRNIMKHVGNDQGLQLSLLSGIYDGDGTFFYEKNIYPRLNLKLTNLPLIVELRDLLIHRGYYPTIVKDDSSVNRAWSLRLYGHEAEKLANNLGYETKDLYDKPSDTSKNYFIKGGYVYSKVKKINTTKDREVLSIEVSDFTHSYLSMGYINKNTQMNLGKWRGQMEGQIKKWKSDPNHIGVFPIPIGYQELGGNARALLLTPELRFLEETIINSLGVPLEFIRGGSTFTSGSVSLRIVENHFLTYRELLTDFLNHFVVTKLNQLLNYPKVELKFKSFKMADDAQAKQLAINLNAAGKISDSKLLSEFGYNPVEEKDMLKQDQATQLDDLVETQKKQAQAQGEAQIVATKYQIRSEQAAMDERFRLKLEMFEEELAAENVGVPEDLHRLVERYAQQVFNMDDASRNQTLQKMSKTMPVTHSFVFQRLQELIMEQQAQFAQAQAAEAPANNQAPNQQEVGTRKQDQVEITGDKKKGATKGNV